jgi:hypothetical protein
MIVVRIELWPGGDSRDLKVLDQITITNIGDSKILSGVTRYEVRHGDRTELIHHRRPQGALVLASRALRMLENLEEDA